MKAATEKHVRAATPFRARATRSSARPRAPARSLASDDRSVFDDVPFSRPILFARAVEHVVVAMTPVEIPAENLSAEELAEFEARAKAYSKKKTAPRVAEGHHGQDLP